MKNILTCMAILVIIFFAQSCTKCYTCVNECQTCTFTSNGNVIATEKICSDSSNYKTKTASLVANGYVCTKATGGYRQDFCINKDGETQYMAYYSSNGRYICTARK